MSALPWRLGVATLGLLFGALACAHALVLALSFGVTLEALLLPLLVGSLLAFAAAGGVFVYTRSFVRALDTLQQRVLTQDAGAAALGFDESHGLATDLQALTVPRVESSTPPVTRKHDGMALRVRFIAAMGHDLRSPLNAMLGFADLVALDRESTWNEQQRNSLAILRERTRDLLSLIDGMIDWAKLESGVLELAPKVVPAAPLIERAVAEAKERSGARGLRVQVALDAELGTVRVDAERFVQALLGLMDHAARADNAPTLALRASREARGPTGEMYLRVDVIDAQLEIRDEDREHLFEAFRPSYAPTGRRIAGLRLGTAIARSLMRAQGGDVWFERRPERGTTFVLAART